MDPGAPYIKAQRPARRAAPDDSYRYTPGHDDSWDPAPLMERYEDLSVIVEDDMNLKFMQRPVKPFKILSKQRVRIPDVQQPRASVPRLRPSFDSPVQNTIRLGNHFLERRIRSGIIESEAHARVDRTLTTGASESSHKFRNFRANAKLLGDTKFATKEKKTSARGVKRKSVKKKSGKNGKKDTKKNGKKNYGGKGSTGKMRSNTKRLSRSSTATNRFPYARRPLTVWMSKSTLRPPKLIPLRSKASMYNAALNLRLPPRASSQNEENAPPRRIQPIIQFKNSLGLVTQAVEKRDVNLLSVDKGIPFKPMLCVNNDILLRKDTVCKPVNKLLATIKKIQSLNRPKSGVIDVNMPNVPSAPKTTANLAHSCELKAKDAYLRSRELFRRRSADTRTDLQIFAGGIQSSGASKLERRLSEVFKCDQCPCEFLFKSSLDAHHRVCHKDEKLQETATVAAFANSPTSTLPGGLHQCKYCDKKLALLTALHIHQLKYCPKIPAKDRRRLNFTELDHVKKPPVPHMSRSRHSMKVSTQMRHNPSMGPNAY